MSLTKTTTTTNTNKIQNRPYRMWCMYLVYHINITFMHHQILVGYKHVYLCWSYYYKSMYITGRSHISCLEKVVRGILWIYLFCLWHIYWARKTPMGTA